MGDIESVSSPLSEAKFFLSLLREQSADEIRNAIGDTDEFRRATRRIFDSLLLRVSVNELRRRNRIRLLPKAGGKMKLGSALEEEIIQLLRAGVSQREVSQRTKVGPTIIRAIAKKIGASFLKPHGRGRRFTAEMREKIRAAVASGRRSIDIERELEIDEHTVRAMRHALGDFENRRHRKKLSAEQIQQAAKQVSAGKKWRDVAREMHVSPTTLLRWCRFRKRPNWHFFSFTEIEEVREAVKLGHGKRRIAEALKRPRSSVALVMNRLRAKHPELPQRAGILPKQRAKILKARAEGKSFAAVGREFGLTAGGVFRIVKRGEAHG